MSNRLKNNLKQNLDRSVYLINIESSSESIEKCLNNEINVNSLKSDVICSQSICKVKTHSIESFECNEEMIENNKYLNPPKLKSRGRGRPPKCKGEERPPKSRRRGRPMGSVGKQFKCFPPECGFTSKNKLQFNSHILIHSNPNEKSTESHADILPVFTPIHRPLGLPVLTPFIQPSLIQSTGQLTNEKQCLEEDSHSTPSLSLFRSERKPNFLVSNLGQLYCPLLAINKYQIIKIYLRISENKFLLTLTSIFSSID